MRANTQRPMSVVDVTYDELRASASATGRSRAGAWA